MASKRFKKWLAIGVGVFVLLLVAAMAVALNSGVQTSVARGILLKADPAAKLDSVSFGFGGGSVRGLEMRVGPNLFKAGELRLKFSLWNMLFGKVRVIDDLTADNLVLDLAQTQPSREASPKPAATEEKGSPAAVLLKNADITCTLLLPDNRTAKVKFTGHDLGAGGKGQATGELVFRDDAPGAKVTEMSAKATLDLACSDAMQPQNVNLAANLSAVVPGQAQPAQLVVRLEAQPRNDKEGDFSLLLSDPAVAGAATPALLSIKGSYGAGGSAKGSFAADLERAKIAPFALGLPLPDFDLLGSGEWQTNGANGETSIKGKLAGHAGRLGAIDQKLEQLGSVKVDADVDVAFAKGKFIGRALTATLAPAEGNPALSLNLLTPFTVEQDGKSFKLTQGAGVELVRLMLDNAPAAWLAPWLPANYTLSGRSISGEIVGGRRADGAILLNTTKPLTATGLSFAHDQSPLLGGTYLEFDSSIVYEPGEKSAKILAQVRKFLCSVDSVPVSGGVLKRSGAPGAIVTAQYAGNVTATLGADKPEFGGTGHVAVALEIDQADRVALGADLPAISPGGRVLLDATFDVAQGAKSWDIAQLQANLTKGAAQLASAKVLQKVSVPMGANNRPGLPNVTGNVATVDISNLPLTLLQPFLGAGRKVTGMAEHAQFLITGGGAGEAGLDFRAAVPLSVTNLQYAEGNTTKISGVTLTLTPGGSWHADGIVTKTVLNASVPAGVLVRATVDFSQSPEQMTANLTADGRLGALATQPFAAEWREVLANPAPEYTLSANIVKTSTALTINNAAARILPPGGSGSAIGDVRLLQTVKLEADADGKYGWPKLSGDTAAIKLSDVPVGVVGLFVPGWALQGRGVNGDVMVRGDGTGTYTMTSNSTITVGNLTLARTASDQPREPWLRDLNISTRPSIKFNDTGLTYFNAPGLDLSSGGTQIGSGNLEMTFAKGRAWWQQLKAGLRMDLGQLLKQPIMAKFNNLEDGTLELDAETGADGAIRLNAKATAWKIRSPRTDVRSFTFSNIAGKYDADKGALQLGGSLLGQDPKGATDCTFTTSLGPAGPARNFSFNLTGSGLVVDELQALYNALKPAPDNSRPAGAPAPAATPTTAEPDKAAFWGGVQGRAQIQLQRLVYGGFILDGVQAGADVTPTQVSIPAIAAQFSGAPISVNGTLAFNAASSSQPYQLQAKIALRDFDVGQYFHNRNPGAKPPAEGKFTVTGALAGRGANLSELAARVPFEFSLNSNGGVFHVLDLVKNKNATAGAAITVGQGVASILGGVLGQKVPVVSQGLSLFDELVKALDSVDYNTLILVAKRGDDGNVNLTQFEVRNPLVQLVGTGSIQYMPNLSLPDQPLTATMQLNAAGRPAQILGSAGLLQQGTVGGYQQGPQFQVTGSLQNMNYDSLYLLLGRAILGSGVNMFK